MNDWKGALNQMKPNLPKAAAPTPNPPVQSQPDPNRPAATTNSYRSVEVKNKDRAGRAPYNFVPLPAEVKEAEAPPTADRYHTSERLSGIIELSIEAKTDFYIRGMWKLSDYPGNEIKNQQGPFQAGCKLRLPGSALRGMTRTLVEILSQAPLEPINDRRHFFRAVGASDNPDHGSFDVTAVPYKDRIKSGRGTRDDPAFPRVQVGYLHSSGDEWVIHPAMRDTNDLQWYRITCQPHEARPKPIYFQRPADTTTDRYLHSRVYFKYGIVDANKCGDRDASPVPPGWATGYLIQSGYIRGKYQQWIVNSEAPNLKEADKVKIPAADVAAYRSDKNRRGRNCLNDGEPCFYVVYGAHVWFGHTPYFRVPFEITTAAAIPQNLRSKENAWYLPQAIFGRAASRGESFQGRVFFEDGEFQSGPDPSIEPGPPMRSVLGEPKPTTFQHYLVQTEETVPKSIHWDGNTNGKKAVLRGHKLYWHRPEETLVRNDSAKDDQVSLFKRAKKGCKFNASVRYENLTAIELGVILTALQLPEECAHKLGMGKPLGLGSMRIEVTLHKLSRSDRYEKFFQSGTKLCTGLGDGEKDVSKYQQQFSKWIRPDSKPTEAWSIDEERIKDLRALLTFTGRETAEWTNATRYLKFGKDPTERKPHNEYNEVRREQGGQLVWKPYKEKRRPLPPASQVKELGIQIPIDREPDFEIPGAEGQRRNSHGIQRGGGRAQQRHGGGRRR